MLVNATELREASAPRRAGMHACQHALTGLASRTHVEQGLAQAAARCCWTRPRGYCRRTTTLPIE